MRPGFTFVELMLSLILTTILAAVALPRLGGALDHVAVRGAAVETMALLASARATAIARAARVSVLLDDVHATVALVADGDTVARRPLGQVHGVALSVNRDALLYAPSGRGYGASNATLILSRGAAVETITVSRLGRARW